MPANALETRKQNVAKKKPPTKTVRVFSQTADDLTLIANAFDLDFAEYLEIAAGPAIKRDLPEAKRLIAKRAGIVDKIREKPATEANS